MENKQIVNLALLTAIAAGLHIFESFLPKPFPFFRIGLANIVVLLLIVEKRYSAALVVLLGKTVAGGIISGLLFSPTTLISVSGGILAVIAMIVAQKSRVFSLIGISICGAVGHNIGQLLIVRYTLIKSAAVYNLLPYLLLLGLAMGFLTGIVVYRIREQYFGNEIYLTLLHK
ncbi:MAG: Gx transporter family protein [Candidatus Cloacimonetes bacterium]|nr:Gx transporter family protein [Candidatus Cloacimonadota bacterium]